LPQGDPTAGLPLIEYQLSLTDYRTDNGLTWPRRLTLVANGKSIEETRVSKYEINPKIKASVFAVSD
jgi:hypothetical protein